MTSFQSVTEGRFEHAASIAERTTPLAVDDRTPAAPDGPRLRSVLSHEFLEAVRPERLVRFLRRYESYFVSRGVRLDPASCDAAWRAHLHAVLAAFDPDRPAALQANLRAIADLTTDAAHEQLLALSHHSQLGLFSVDCTTTPEDVALELYLRDESAFRTEHARATGATVKRFVEFSSCTIAPLETPVSPARLVVLETTLSDWFRGRNRTGFCEVHVTCDRDEVTFQITHGIPPKSTGTIQNDRERSHVTFVPAKRDAVVYNNKTGRLAVNAQFPVENEFYRETFGRIFWNDAAHFEPRLLFTGAPFIELGEAVLDPSGVPGLVAVELLELYGTLDGKLARRFALTGADYDNILADPIWKLAAPRCTITGYSLSLTLQGYRRPVRVDVTTPIRLSFDRQLAPSSIVNEYLIARALWLIDAPEAPRAPKRGRGAR